MQSIKQAAKLLRFAAALAFGLGSLSAHAADPLVIQSDQPGPVINRDIFGQFSEHLGEGIYGGIWVGPDSRIPNVRGIRSDVVQALRANKVPVVRWPGGCFADRYHWRDGIGPASQRPKRLNADWGGVIEPNSFGTHEFMDFIDQIGSEAYISVNVGTGSVQEAADWLEYMTSTQPTSLVQERTANGHPKPWRVKYIGIGNESWGCGGPYSPEAYVDELKRYSRFIINYHPDQMSPSGADFLATFDPAKPDFSKLRPGPNAMRRIAVGPDGANTEYTDAVMKAWQTKLPFSWNIEGLSLHFYTTGKGMPMIMPSTDFGNGDYALVLKDTLRMNGVLSANSAVMDKYDPDKKVALVVDEWGAWLRAIPGRNPVFLRQQNSLRDAIVAALNLNIFARHADRVRMANIAQTINVIQSMILTENDRMLLTPTYYIYRMYVPFQDARLLPVSLTAGEYREGSTVLPAVDAVAARSTDGRVWLAAVNLDPEKAADIPVKIAGVSPKAATGQVLTGLRVNSINTFDKPGEVAPQPFSARPAGGELTLHLPPKSVVVVKLD